MPVEIQTLMVKEGGLKNNIKGFAQDGANVITAINAGGGNYFFEATFIDPGPQDSITKIGTMSTFGGPHDLGMGADEGLALYKDSDIGTAPAGLFLDSPPPGTTGSGRRLNPAFNYLACRWDYTLTPPNFLRQNFVTVSANGKSVAARPVDYGPNIVTGRVADLSEGLAHALGLDTESECRLVIPLPPGTAIPIPQGTPAAVDLTAIDAITFAPDMTRTLVVMTTSNNTTYWVVNLAGEQEGGQTLMRQVASSRPDLLLSDTVLFPIKADAQVPAAVVAELNKAFQKEPDIRTGPAAAPPGPGDDINAKMFAAARAFVRHDTSKVPGTSNGVNACAWAVNEVTKLALGKPISSDEHGNNGLTTLDMFKVLKNHHTELNSARDARPGMIIIAPTRGENHGHVGIVGTTDGSVDNTQVFSNSSSHHEFLQNYTVEAFTNYFEGKKGLQVLFFALNPNQFIPVA